MSEGRSAWLDPRFILTLILVVGGGIGSYTLASYRLGQVENKVAQFEALKLELMQQDVRQTKSLVKQIAREMGIKVPDE